MEEKISIYCLVLGIMKVNCWIVKDNATSYTAIIDPGGFRYSDSVDKIVDKCKDIGAIPKAVILTHAHFDHMMSLDAVRERFKVPLYIQEEDNEALGEPEHTYMNRYAKSDKPSAPAEYPLKDGDIITLGETEFKVMHTPGHTMGSMCLITDGHIFSGDTLFAGSVGRCDLYGGDEFALRYSLRQLTSLDGNYKIHPGHGGTTTLEREKLNNIYLKTL